MTIDVPALPVEFSPAAIEQLAKQVKKHVAGSAVRLYVKPAGCSGLQYKIDIVEAPQADDKQYDLANGITLYIPSKSIPFLEGTVIDYVKQGLNAKFQFTNPQQKGACGCGESFYV